MPRIAIFLQDLAGGGAERVMVNLSEGLASIGASVDLVLVRAEGPFLGTVSSSVRLVPLRTGRVMASVPALVRYIEQERPDAIISALVHVNVAAIVASRMSRHRPRVIVTDHNDVALDRRNTPERPVRLAYQLMPLVYRLASGIVGVSRGVSASVARAAWLPPTRVHTIYNPVLAPTIPAMAARLTGHPWLDDKTAPVVLAIGRLMKQKDFPTLLHAFARLATRKDVRLIILGEGDQRQSLEAEVAKLGLQERVALPGFSSNPYAWMARCDVFAMSSLWEGLPTVLIEALSLGANIVATDCPHGPSEILLDGRLGRLVPPAAPEALAAALESALDTPSPTDAGRERAREFSIEVVSRQYLSVALGVT
jgi:glycosyltransferase involved in cell wall biosynthesis